MSDATRPAVPVAGPEWDRLAARLAILALLWLGLAGRDLASWVVGAPAVVVAAFMSYRLRTARLGRIRPLEALRFATFFVRESLRGGLDVSLRALNPGLPIRPGMLEIHPRLPPGAARHLFAATIGLLPGTMVVEIADDRLVVHALSRSPAVEAELRRLEERVAALFGIALPETGP